LAKTHHETSQKRTDIHLAEDARAMRGFKEKRPIHLDDLGV